MRCPACGGRGAVLLLHHYDTCRGCKGRGWLRLDVALDDTQEIEVDDEVLRAAERGLERRIRECQARRDT